ncbi:MAG TPA: SpoIIE family protein phosphatase [Streptosporangiaceae bacterium]|jgi:serine phosphatase RsbU (regulator of sigma subunit)/PAS domain-containing protein
MAPRPTSRDRGVNRPARREPSPSTAAAGQPSRGAELRLAASLPGAELRPLLDAALAELEAAARRPPAGADRGPSGAAHAERRLLHAVFQQLPVPVFLLGQDTTIRRVNSAAARLLGSGPGYATGKQFAALVDMPVRGRLQSQLADAFRTGQPAQLSASLLSADGLVACELTVCLAGLRGDTDQLIVAVTAAGDGARSLDGTHAGHDSAGAAEHTAAEHTEGNPADLRLVKQLTRRLDLAAAAARLLLENITLSESATLQRCARLLVNELAAWVIVDVEHRGGLRRHFVIGPDEPAADELARIVSDTVPEPGSAPSLVHESASSLLITHAEDTDSMGTGPDGIPLVMLMGATSVLCVPLSDSEHSYGALTLLRRASEGHFGLVDVATAEEIGEQLALAIRADRMFRRRSEVAEAVQASLLPTELMRIPGVEIATAHIASADGPDVGGDFYDAYRTPEGWGITIGEVCGTGLDVIPLTSAAQHAIRVIARSNQDPAAVLRGANEILLAERLDSDFVTAHAVHLRWADGILRVVLASAGQPAPALVTSGGQARQLRGGGQPLGIFPDAEPSAQELELSTGDVLFFFTDGVTDARSPQLGYFGDHLTDELAGLAGRSPADTVSRMRRCVLEFCDSQVRDEMTMLALRVGEPPDF